MAEPHYQAYVAASSRLETDSKARSALVALQRRQQALQAVSRLSAVSPEEQAELEALREAFVSVPAVAAFVAAESKLKALCQAAGSQLSQSLGIDFAGACSTGCC